MTQHAGKQRIAKLLASRGLCSRREAERLIEAGHVLVDGVVVRQQGSKALPDVEIVIAAGGRSLLAAKLTVILHKPAGIVSNQPGPGQVPAWKLIGARNGRGGIEPADLERLLAAPQSLAVAGRLDRASRGLLVLTQDGAIARRIIGGHAVEKVYVVRAAGAIGMGQVRKLGQLRQLDGRPLRPMQVKRVSRDTLRFVLVEGRKHQIRRAARKFGLEVVDLFREAVGPFHIGDLREGHWRLANAGELERLRSKAPR